MHTRVKRITSYLEFKLYKQDNISHDTGQIFAVTFFSEKKQHICEHYQYYCPLVSSVSPWNSCS